MESCLILRAGSYTPKPPANNLNVTPAHIFRLAFLNSHILAPRLPAELCKFSPFQRIAELDAEEKAAMVRKTELSPGELLKKQNEFVQQLLKNRAVDTLSLL